MTEKVDESDYPFYGLGRVPNEQEPQFFGLGREMKVEGNIVLGRHPSDLESWDVPFPLVIGEKPVIETRRRWMKKGRY
jgi:hypothetical protein